MKTVLFFYLNTLGPVLILTQTPPPYFASFTTDCKLTKAGQEYAGPLSVTRSGLTCQRWNSDQPHSHRFNNSTLFPEGSAEAAGNKCRNPDDHDEGVWCYTTNSTKRWELCDLKFCDCKLTKAGHEYAGPLNVTRSGRTCQRWNSDLPHGHNYKEGTLFPEGSDEAAGNKCRNPERGHNEGVWCYTTDPETRWEQCDVELCNCQLQSDLLGSRYEGKINHTRSGRQCSFWTSQTPKPHPFNESIFYPDASVAEASNYCRNPNASRPEGPWCFTNDTNIEWEYCLIPVCSYSEPIVVEPEPVCESYVPPFTSDCKLTKAGREYAGPLSVTRSGLTCQRWVSNQPHSHNLKNSTLFPEGSVWAAGNKCRNPDNHDDGVWCYTTNPEKRWELCDVDFCDCKVTKGGHEYAGHLNVTRSGLTCQRWISDQPHNNNYKTSKLFPEGSASAAGNKCRNPERGYNEGVWCYTTNPNKRWEECNVDLCVFSTKPRNSTPLSQTSSTRTRTYTQRTMLPYTVGTRSMPASPTNPRTIRLSPTQLPQGPISRENASNNIAQIVIPIVGVNIVTCVIVAIIVWRRTGRFQQRTALSLETTPKHTDGFENPMYADGQQLIEIVQ